MPLVFAHNGEPDPLFLITFLLLIVAIGIIVLVWVYQKKQLQYLRDKEQLRILFDNEILESKLEIQEQTFKSFPGDP